MEVGTFRIYCHFCVRLRHLTSWRFCTENMYFCFTWYFHIDSKIYLHFIFSKSFTYFWKHTFNMCWTRTSVKILIWCKKKKNNKTRIHERVHFNGYLADVSYPFVFIQRNNKAFEIKNLLITNNNTSLLVLMNIIVW